MAKKKHTLPNELPANLSDLDYLLLEEGPLDSGWKAFESREAQQKMFKETLLAFKNGTKAVIEAGTGTGKTLAYLLPALISGKKTFISTGLKNLQEQIYQKDLKFIKEHFNKNIKAVVLKGRQNYICKRLLFSFENRLQNSFDDEIRDFVKLLVRWVDETKTGEIEELNAFDYINKLTPPFNRLYSTGENCLGRNCPYNEKCFVSQVRKKAMEADLVLINHHLFMADLSLKRNVAGFLPDFEAIIIDEAHLLLDVASNYFSYKFSTKGLMNAIIFLQQAINWELLKDTLNTPEYAKTLNQLKKMAESVEEDILFIFNRYSNIDGEDFLWPKTNLNLWEKRDKDFKDLLSDLSKKLDTIIDNVNVIEDKNDDFKNILGDLVPNQEALIFIVQNNDDSYVYQVKSDRENVELAAIPIDVAPFLEKNLFLKNKTIILCSATLSTDGNLDYFKKKTGITTKCSSLILSSPFNYEKNAKCYIPNSMVPPPEPGEPTETYDEALVEQIQTLLEITEGRALVLFTSFRQLNMVKNVLSKSPKSYRLLHQDPGIGRTQLLDDFRRDVHSVLLATHSFWQGVDIPGQSLSAVIIDKIPFPRPNTPLTKAKSQFIIKQKGNPFSDFFIPEATLNLKQGIGRLLRSKNDWGLIAILDSRVHHKQYGHKMYKDLMMPGRILTSRLSDVKKFFNEKNAQF
jgi:ATP-dependent DNA helicase DinG